MEQAPQFDTRIALPLVLRICRQEVATTGKVVNQLIRSVTVFHPSLTRKTQQLYRDEIRGNFK
mgnify:CR=1 FL=1